MLVAFQKAWLKKSKTNPILFNSVNGMLLYGLGDIAQQKVDLSRYNHQKKNKKKYFVEELEKDTRRQDHKKPFNGYQLTKMVSWAFFSAPLFHIWYSRALPLIVPVVKNPSNKQAVSKVIVDYLIASSM